MYAEQAIKILRKRGWRNGAGQELQGPICIGQAAAKANCYIELANYIWGIHKMSIPAFNDKCIKDEYEALAIMQGFAQHQAIIEREQNDLAH